MVDLGSTPQDSSAYRVTTRQIIFSRLSSISATSAGTTPRTCLLAQVVPEPVEQRVLDECLAQSRDESRCHPSAVVASATIWSYRVTHPPCTASRSG